VATSGQTGMMYHTYHRLGYSLVARYKEASACAFFTGTTRAKSDLWSWNDILPRVDCLRPLAGLLKMCLYSDSGILLLLVGNLRHPQYSTSRCPWPVL